MSTSLTTETKLVPYLNPETGELEMVDPATIPQAPNTDRESLFLVKVMQENFGTTRSVNPMLGDQLYPAIRKTIIEEGLADDPDLEQNDKKRDTLSKRLENAIDSYGQGTLYLQGKSPLGELYIFLGERVKAIPLGFNQQRALLPNPSSGHSGGPLCNSIDNRVPSTANYRLDDSGKVVHKTLPPVSAPFSEKITGRGSGGGFKPPVQAEINLDFKPLKGTPNGGHFCTVSTSSGWQQPHCLYAKGEVVHPKYGKVMCKPSFAVPVAIKVMHPLLNEEVMVLAEVYFKGTTLFDGINLEKMTKELRQVNRQIVELVITLHGISSREKMGKGKLSGNDQAKGYVIEIETTEPTSAKYLDSISQDEGHYKFFVDRLEHLFKSAQELITSRLSFAQRQLIPTANLLPAGMGEDDPYGGADSSL